MCAKLAPDFTADALTDSLCALYTKAASTVLYLLMPLRASPLCQDIGWSCSPDVPVAARSTRPEVSSRPMHDGCRADKRGIASNKKENQGLKKGLSD